MRRATKATDGGPKKRRDWKPQFLLALARTGNVSGSAAVAGVERTAVYRAHRADPAFREKFKEAEVAARDALEAEARRRAVEGVEDYQTFMGDLIWVRVDASGRPLPPGKKGRGAGKLVPLTARKYSDNLLARLLTARHPAYRAVKEVRHSGGTTNANLNVNLTPDVLAWDALLAKLPLQAKRDVLAALEAGDPVPPARLPVGLKELPPEEKNARG